MTTLKHPDIVLAVEDTDSDNGSINRRRWDGAEDSPLLHSGHGNDEGEFDPFLDPVSLERLPWYTRPSVCQSYCYLSSCL